MNKKIIFPILFLIILMGIFLGFKTSNNLNSPGFTKIFTKTAISKPTPEPTPATPVAPTTFQFSQTTDLKSELDKVNPEVLDSDFE